MSDARRLWALSDTGVIELEIRDEPTGCIVKDCGRVAGLFVSYNGVPIGLSCAKHRPDLHRAGCKVRAKLRFGQCG